MIITLNHVVQFTTPDCDDYEDSFVILTDENDKGVICISTPDDDLNGVDLGFVKAAVNRLFRDCSFETSRSDFMYTAASPSKLCKFMGHVNVFNEFFANVPEDDEVIFGMYATTEEV